MPWLRYIYQSTCVWPVSLHVKALSRCHMATRCHDQNATCADACYWKFIFHGIVQLFIDLRIVPSAYVITSCWYTIMCWTGVKHLAYHYHGGLACFNWVQKEPYNVTDLEITIALTFTISKFWKKTCENIEKFGGKKRKRPRK